MCSLNLAYIKYAFVIMAIGFLSMVCMALMTGPKTTEKGMMARGWIPTIIMIVGVIFLWIMPFKEYGAVSVTIYESIRLIFTVAINIFLIAYWSIILSRRSR